MLLLFRLSHAIFTSAMSFMRARIRFSAAQCQPPPDAYQPRHYATRRCHAHATFDECLIAFDAAAAVTLFILRYGRRFISLRRRLPLMPMPPLRYAATLARCR